MIALLTLRCAATVLATDTVHRSVIGVDRYRCSYSGAWASSGSGSNHIASFGLCFYSSYGRTFYHHYQS